MEDRVVPVEVGQQLVRDLPIAQLITYEKTGHLITEERPEVVIKNILLHTIYGFNQYPLKSRI